MSAALNPDTASATVGKLIAEAIASSATDIHLHCDGPVFYRAQGKLSRVTAAGVTDSRGLLLAADFNLIVGALGLENSNQSKMVGFRSFSDGEGKSYPIQCRSQRAKLNSKEALLLRLQPESPPQLSVLLKGTEALKRLTNAQGLILVVGPMGAGKSTFAAALARHWADQNRHVLTCEDPVEYTLSSNFGFVSQQDVSLAGFSGGLSIQEAQLKAMRLDIDGLYVGETRNAETLQFGLQFARSYEPVVTTYHAGSIGDAITSLYQVSGLPFDVARSAIGNVLNSVVYVNLAYTAKGAPVPVIMVLPINDPAFRGNLLTGHQQNIGRLVDEACAGTRPFDGQISRREAIARALAAGATKESVDAALPPENKGDSRQVSS